ncbi:hypothetical protein TVAG_374760 [Trichomonas vaginalis G3]|uniref:Uncharacterized protein n=1 Tax=Trichomonas vaginalis (strain ATCC PRA-98 / G3) TaxID=412133 RepID=A2FCI9_TRIV3|nr:WD40 repeat-like family [Trichomonas vaginalis G3]EAX97395.1 hypothetical protein TVAG_374760 [Trichomonas vaginalis G3]KAI5547291.1 WD40 repeat-like family [Trichomonas vaginalis G3]|eukprot:XP_001310325.1 hypothetical protein [Trichomonas vaginalis G3]
MPIIVSTEKTNTVLPSQFKYSYVHWLGNLLGVFAYKEFGFLKYFAAGTEEGPIVIFGDTGKELHQVALLCGHTRTITGITTSLHPDTFTSVSYDGVICGWSMCDGICLYSFQANVKPGYLKAINSTTNVDLLYLWSLGGSFYTLNVKTGETQMIVQSFGITSLYPTLGETVLYTTYNSICSYNINTKEKITKRFEPSLDKRQWACENGYVSIKGNRIRIYNTSYIFMFSITVNELQENEPILKVYWRSLKTIQIITYLGTQIIIKLNAQDAEYSITKTPSPHYFTAVSFTNREQFLGVVCDNSIYVQDQNGERIFVGDNNNRNYHLSSGDYQHYYASDHTNYITYYKLNDAKSRYNHEHSRVTCLYSIQYRNTEYLITGSINGTVTVYTKNSEEPLFQYPALSCPVIGLVQTPFVINGSPRILAIAEDGSSCLFNMSDIRIHYLGNHFRPRNVYVYESMGLLFFQYQGGNILMYNLDTPDAVAVLSVVPPKAKLIWSYSIRKIDQSLTSVGTVTIGGKGIAFDTHNFSELKSLSSDDELFKNDCLKFIKLCDETSKSFDDQLVFIGADQNPTFYYKNFAIRGEILYMASPYVIVNHWVVCNMISTICGVNKANQNRKLCVECLPMLLEMLFYEHPIIQNIVSPLITSITQIIQSMDCQQMISTFISEESIDKLSNSNKFLTAITICVNENLVPTYWVKPLYNFLKNSTTATNDVSHVALNILAHGIKAWMKENPHVEVYQFLINSLERYNTSSYLTTLSKSAHEDYPSFLQAFKTYFFSKMEDEPAKMVAVNLLTNSMLDNNLAYLATITLSRLIVDFGLNDMKSHLELHKSIMKAIDYNDNYIIIGTYEGDIIGFSKNKQLFEIPLFKNPISYVSLSPSGDICVVACSKSKDYIALSIGGGVKGGIFKDKHKLLKAGKISGEGQNVKVSWKENNLFDIEFV